MIRHAYHDLNKQNLTKSANTSNKKKKFYTPESWGKGLISLNWEYVNLLWEDRIKSVNSHEENIVDQHANHYFLLQEAIYKLNNHQLRNPNDVAWITKSQDELTKFSSNQLRLWINNIDLLTKIQHHDQLQGCTTLPNLGQNK